MAIIKPIKSNNQETLEEEVTRFHEWQDYYQKETDKLLASQKCEIEGKLKIIAHLHVELADMQDRVNKQGFKCRCHESNTIEELHNELIECEKQLTEIAKITSYYSNY